MTVKKTTRSLRSVRAASAKADEVEQRAYQARQVYLMRQEGRTWWDVAEELGISESVAKNRLDEAIAAAAKLVDEDGKRKLLDLEVARLDALMLAHWKYATQPVTMVDNQGNQVTGPPDVRAGEFVLKIIAARAKLQQLDTMGDGGLTVQTVVVAGTSEEYVAALKSIASRTIPGEVVDESA